MKHILISIYPDETCLLVLSLDETHVNQYLPWRNTC